MRNSMRQQGRLETMSALELVEIVIGIALIVALVGVLLNLGDIARYLRIRNM